MIFSKDLLFLHVPKTGGMSVTDFLINVLPRPVFYTRPGYESADRHEGVIHLEGTRHETLEEAREVVANQGFTLDSFPMVLAVIRNPYALEVSRYFYLRAGHPWDFGPDQTLALTRDFVTFVTKASGGPDLSQYFFLGREIPKNLRVIRFEALAEALPGALKQSGILITKALPHLNRSRHADFQTYYTPRAEEAVYRRHQWVFDLSLYDRLTESLEGTEATGSCLTLPIVGPVRQVGGVTGFWPDLWASPTLRTTLEAREDIALLEIQGYLPEEVQEPIELAAQVDATTVATIHGQAGKRIRWIIPLAQPIGSSFEFQVLASRAQSPCKNSGSDSREIALQVIRMFFKRPEAQSSA